LQNSHQPDHPLFPNVALACLFLWLFCNKLHAKCKLVFRGYTHDKFLYSHRFKLINSILSKYAR
jgi:hypothetical protein